MEPAEEGKAWALRLPQAQTLEYLETSFLPPPNPCFLSRSGFFMPLYVSLRLCFWLLLELWVCLSPSLSLLHSFPGFICLCCLVSVFPYPLPLLIQRFLTEPLPRLPKITLSKMRSNPPVGFFLLPSAPSSRATTPSYNVR